MQAMNRNQIKVLQQATTASALSRTAPALCRSALLLLATAVLTLVCGAFAQGTGILRVSMPGDFVTLDPHRTTTAIERGMIGTIFSALTLLGPDGLPQGDLAASWENPDPLTYEFTLRDNAKFHNGRRVVAADVAYSLQRVKGMEGASRWSGMISDVSGIEVVDDLTVRLTLSQPSAPLLHNLAYIAIVAEEEVEHLTTRPIGSGPFVFQEWTPNVQMRLTANPDFYFPNQPRIAELIWVPMAETATMLANLQTGGIDVASAIDFTAVPQLQSASGVTLVTPEIPTSYGAVFFRNLPPFDNLVLRRAVAAAVNRDAVNRAVYFGLGDSDCNAYTVGHWVYTELDCPAYDLDAARQLLAEAGYAGGLDVTWKMTNFPYAVRSAEIVAESLRQIGVNVTLIPLDLSTFVQEVYVDRDFQIASGAFVREFDPDAVIESVVRTGGGNNPGQYSNARVDELLRLGRAELDQTARAALYAELAQLVVDDVAMVKLSTHPYIWVVRDNVKGLWLDSIGTANVSFRTVTVDD